jgi:hypothetical protein
VIGILFVTGPSFILSDVPAFINLDAALGKDSPLHYMGCALLGVITFVLVGLGYVTAKRAR